MAKRKRRRRTTVTGAWAKRQSSLVNVEADHPVVLHVQTGKQDVVLRFTRVGFCRLLDEVLDCARMAYKQSRGKERLWAYKAGELSSRYKANRFGDDDDS